MVRIALNCLSYHQKTRSIEFFIELIRRNHDTDLFWYDPGERDLKPEILSGKSSYDRFVFFQWFPTPGVLSPLDPGKVILIPMYDGVYFRTRWFWLQYRRHRFLQFSTSLHEKLSRWGFDSAVFPFYPEPSGSESSRLTDTRDPSLFFWQRTHDLTWKTLKQKLDLSVFHRIHLHLAPDPGSRPVHPSPEEIRKHNITISTWFENKEDLLTVMKRCTVYIAPRKYEGIGMSFLEALAAGKCVISLNSPTMNEYITAGRDGYFFGDKRLKITAEQMTSVGDEARRMIESKSSGNPEIRKSILKFIETAPDASPDSRALITLFRILDFPFHFISRLIRFARAKLGIYRG